MKYAIGLPLTGKELIEQAARRRTYVLRVVVGVVLVAVAILALFGGQQYDGQLLGKGRRVFDALVILLAWLPVLLAPALVAASIAGERDDGSLPLLRMTRLGSGTIVMEKWLSRLISVLALQVLALPLLALAYTCGGVPDDAIWWSILGSVLSAAHATALAMIASVWSRGTVGALFAGYGLLLVSYGLPPAITSGSSLPWYFANAPAIALFTVLEAQYASSWLRTSQAAVQGVLMASLVPTTCAMLLSWLLFARRDPGSSGNPLLRLFRRLDSWFERLEGRRLGRAVRHELPRQRPVAWRECNRRTLANPRYLARILIPLGAVIVFGLMFGYGWSLRIGGDIAGWTGMILESGLVLTVAVLGATAFASERSSQTLEVLLTTPLTPRDILLQKVSGLRRVHLAGAILIGLVIAVRALIDDANSSYRSWSPWLALLSVMLLPMSMAWLGLVIGLHVRSRTRAVGTAVGAVVGWTFGGALAVIIAGEVWGLQNDEVVAVAASPPVLGIVNHLNGIPNDEQVAAGISFAVAQILGILLLRGYALHRVSTLLRKV